MKTVEVTLVRHAQTVANATGIWQGQGDSHLSDAGRDQAARWGRRFSAGDWDRVVASDLRRTRDTVAALGRDDVALDRAWREVDVGRWEGLSRAEVRARFGDEIRALQRGEPVKIGGGESWPDLEARVDAALGALFDGLPDGGRALVMTHGGVIHALVSGVLGLRARRFRPIGRIMNTAVTVLRLRGAPGTAGAAVGIRRYNDASHVGPRSEYLEELLADGAGAVAMLSAPGDGAHRDWYPALGPVAALETADVALDGLRPHAEGGLVRGLALDGGLAARLARAALGEDAAIDVDGLAPGRVGHLVWTERGPVLGDYGLGPGDAAE